MSRGARRALGGLLGVACLAVAACRTPPPVDRGTPLDPGDVRPRALIAQLEALARHRQALRATARLRLESPQAQLSRPQRIVAERPARLRIEVLGLFDQVAAVIATDGREYAWVDLGSGTRERGPVDDGVLWRTARVDLTPAEAVSLLLGTPPLPEAPRIDAARLHADGRIAVGLAGRGGAQWLTFGPGGALRRAERRDVQGRIVWSARWSDLRAPVAGSAGDAPFAHALDLDFPRVDAHVAIRFRSVELNPALPSGVFVLQLGTGE